MEDNIILQVRVSIQVMLLLEYYQKKDLLYCLS